MRVGGMSRVGRWLVWLASLSALGCADPDRDALLVVKVEGRLAGLRQLRAEVTLGGRTSSPGLVPSGPAPSDLALPLSFALRAEPGVRGAGELRVEALDEAGGMLGEQRVQVTISAGHAVTVSVCFGAAADCPLPVDGGVADAAPPDAARECSGDGDCTGLGDPCADVHCDRAAGRCVRAPKNQGGSCATSRCDPPGACSYPSACAVAGARAQTCHDFVCLDGVCTDQVRTTNDPTGCARSTENQTCDTPQCTRGPCSYSGLCASSGTRREDCSVKTCKSGVCTPGQTSQMVSTGCERVTEGKPCNLVGWCLQISNTVDCECQQGQCVNPCGVYECRNL